MGCTSSANKPLKIPLAKNPLAKNPVAQLPKKRPEPQGNTVEASKDTETESLLPTKVAIEVEKEVAKEVAKAESLQEDLPAEAAAEAEAEAAAEAEAEAEKAKKYEEDLRAEAEKNKKYEEELEKLKTDRAAEAAAEAAKMEKLAQDAAAEKIEAQKILDMEREKVEKLKSDLAAEAAKAEKLAEDNAAATAKITETEAQVQKLNDDLIKETDRATSLHGTVSTLVEDLNKLASPAWQGVGGGYTFSDAVKMLCAQRKLKLGVEAIMGKVENTESLESIRLNKHFFKTIDGVHLFFVHGVHKIDESLEEKGDYYKQNYSSLLQNAFECDSAVIKVHVADISEPNVSISAFIGFVISAFPSLYGTFQLFQQYQKEAQHNWIKKADTEISDVAAQLMVQDGNTSQQSLQEEGTQNILEKGMAALLEEIDAKALVPEEPEANPGVEEEANPGVEEEANPVVEEEKGEEEKKEE